MVRLTTTDQRLYLYSVQYNGGTSVLGGIKMGQKKLFYRTVRHMLRLQRVAAR